MLLAEVESRQSSYASLHEVCPVVDAAQVIKQPSRVSNRSAVWTDDLLKGLKNTQNTGAYVFPHHFIKKLIHIYL